jgi:uncharacterized protein with HEPN domain
MPLDERDATKLWDMMTWSRKAITILGDLTLEGLMANEEKRLALARCLEVIGEAGHGVSPAVKSALNTIPWPSMYGMRNRLIHDYGKTNYQIVFESIRDDLPGMAPVIAPFLAANGYPA